MAYQRSQFRCHNSDAKKLYEDNFSIKIKKKEIRIGTYLDKINGSKNKSFDAYIKFTVLTTCTLPLKKVFEILQYYRRFNSLANSLTNRKHYPHLIKMKVGAINGEFMLSPWTEKYGDKQVAVSILDGITPGVPNVDEYYGKSFADLIPKVIGDFNDLQQRKLAKYLAVCLDKPSNGQNDTLPAGMKFKDDAQQQAIVEFLALTQIVEAVPARTPGMNKLARHLLRLISQGKKGATFFKIFQSSQYKLSYPPVGTGGTANARKVVKEWHHVGQINGGPPPPCDGMSDDSDLDID